MSREFELARIMVIQEARAARLESYGYAWSYRIYPWFDENPLTAAFADDFVVKADAVGRVIKFVDDDWMNDKKLSFYDIETEFGGRFDGEIDRSALIGILRYAYLSGRFNDELWERLTVPGSGPVESQGIADPFEAGADLFLI